MNYIIDNSLSLTGRQNSRIMTYENFNNADTAIARRIKQKQMIENHCEEYSRSLTTANSKQKVRAKSPTVTGLNQKGRFDVHGKYLKMFILMII